MKKSILIWLVIGVGVICGIYIFWQNNSNNIKPTNTSISMHNLPQSNPSSHNTINNSKTMTTYTTKPPILIDTNKSYSAVFKTSEGEFTVELNVKDTPITTNNFVFLARQGFYNNTIFHRIMKNFMIQGGDPTGTGMGGPGYKFDDEKIIGEYTRGTLAMANSGHNTNGSQFFIMHQDYPLSKDYVIFGKVVQGLDVIDKIANTPVQLSAQGDLSVPINPPTIYSIDIIEK